MEGRSPAVPGLTLERHRPRKTFGEAVPEDAAPMGLEICLASFLQRCRAYGTARLFKPPLRESLRDAWRRF
jgi:hypothetical protein